eukprot:9380675-Alexandrium_andersonii.AAC.1
MCIRDRWRTPAAGDAGLAWCAECLPAGSLCVSAAAGPARALNLSFPEGRPHPPQWSAPGGDPDYLLPSAYGACPLCGVGESSAEHLM